VVILWICVFLVVVLLVFTIQTKAVFVMNDDPNAQSTGRRQYHVVFSTSCSPFQNWQSIAFFYFAHRVRQPGHITRLVSGCTAEQAKDLQKVHDQQVAPLSDKYHLHITPDFGHNNQGDEKYWNKPHGLLSFMETELGYSKEKPNTIHDDDVIIILDPDMMLLKPITDDFSDYVGLWKNDLTQVKVQHGKPIAQRYEYGAQWLTTLGKRVEEVVGPRSPVLKMNTTEANLYYPAGPPYLATAKVRVFVGLVELDICRSTYFSLELALIVCLFACLLACLLPNLYRFAGHVSDRDVLGDVSSQNLQHFSAIHGRDAWLFCRCRPLEVTPPTGSRIHDFYRGGQPGVFCLFG
jgi:hypothetical protein